MSEKERIDRFFDNEAPELVKKAARDIVHKHLKEIAEPQTAEEIRAANPLRKQPEPPVPPAPLSRAELFDLRVEEAMAAFRELRSRTNGSVGLIVRSWNEERVKQYMVKEVLRGDVMYCLVWLDKTHAPPEIVEYDLLRAAAKYVMYGSTVFEERMQNTLTILDEIYKENYKKFNYPRMVIDRRAKLPTRKRKHVKSRDCCCCAQQGRHPPVAR